MGETVTLATVEAALHQLADAIEAIVEKPGSLTARTMLGDAVTKVTKLSAEAVKGGLAAAARERDLIARLQEAERRYQARQTELLAANTAEVGRRRAAEEGLASVKGYANRVLACVSACHELLNDLQTAAYAATAGDDDTRMEPLHALLLKRYCGTVSALGLYVEGEKLGLPEAMPEPDTCIGCDALIPTGTPAYRFRDGEKACEACAPTWAEDLKEAEQAVLGGGTDPDEDDVAWRDRVRAKIAAGAVPSAKAVS